MFRIGEVELTPSSADALDALDIIGHVGMVNVDMPAMAWLWLVAQELHDDPATFPRGKWATLQHIEAQLRAAAKDRASDLAKPVGDQETPRCPTCHAKSSFAGCSDPFHDVSETAGHSDKTRSDND